MAVYDIGQYCVNGHFINGRALSEPDDSKDFCSECGARTITTCQTCEREIPGEEIDALIVYEDHSAPKYCHYCGNPFPWTVTALQAARELADELENISDGERAMLKSSIDELVKDTPKTTVAAMRFKRIVTKAGPEAASMFRDIMIGVVTTAIARQIGIG